VEGELEKAMQGFVILETAQYKWREDCTLARQSTKAK
jgi:hypothetical protein